MRTKKALYNLIAQMTYEIVAMVCGLILPRFILSAFGSSYNGMISSIAQFLDYISVLTLGISGSTRIAIYKANASNDPYKVSAILKATEQYMRKVASIFILYLIILSVVYPFIVRNEFQWGEVASLVVIIGLGTFAEYFFGITYKTFLMANQSMYIYNIIQVASKIVNTLISVVLILLNQKIQVVKLGSAICFVATPIILNCVVRKKYHIIKNVEPDNSALKQRNEVMAHSIANTIHQYTDIFLLTIFTTSATVSVYTVYNLVLSSLRKLQHVFTTGLEAAFGDLWAHEEYDRFEKNFNIFEFLIFSFVSVVFSCTAVLIIPFVSLYTKNVTDINYILPIYAGVAVFAEAFFCIRMPYLIAVQAAGRYKETRNGAFLESALNFFVSLAAIYKYGLIGVVLGTMVANIFRTIQYAFYLSKKLLNRSIGVFIRKCIWTLLNISITLAVHSVLLNLPVVSWSEWIVAGLLTAVLACGLVILSAFIFYRQCFFQSYRIFLKMFKGKRI